MNRYFQEINLPGKRLARRCGVSHSQIYMARRRNVGPDYAEQISRGVANILGLFEKNRLLLKAEIMGHPDNQVRAYLGSGADAATALGEDLPIGEAVVSETKTLAHASGRGVIRKLKEMRVQEEVVAAVRRKVRPKPERPSSVVTHRQSGLEARNRRAEALFYFRLFKPQPAKALDRSSLSKKELYQRAGVGKETLRKALYQYVNRRSAQKIASALGEAAGLTKGDIETVEDELRTAPEKTF